MSFVFIQPGEFKTSASAGRPSKTVKITRPYYIGKYEVTRREWNLMEIGKYAEQDHTPARSITALARKSFITMANQTLDPEVRNEVRFADPNQSQWEYACRAGTTTDFSFGDMPPGKIGDYAWYGSNSQRNYKKVGQKKPNKWQLYDMHGSMWEWVEPWEGDYPDPAEAQAKVDEKLRVLRGGSLFDNPRAMASSYARIEKAMPANARDALMGLRLVLRLGPEAASPAANRQDHEFTDVQLTALNRQQEQAYAHSHKTDTEARKLASKYDYKGAMKLYDGLAADPRFKNMQNTIANQRQMVRDASEAFSSAMSAISRDAFGGTRIRFGDKIYKIKDSKPGQLTLENDGKETVLAIKDIAGSDLFRLAVLDQKQLGMEGHINLFRFASMARDTKSLIPKATAMLNKFGGGDINAHLITWLKPTLFVMTKPTGATIRIRSRNPNPYNKPVDSTPFFSFAIRDAKLNTTYVLEISKEGYETVEHTVKVTKPGPTAVSLVLKASPKKENPDKLDDPKLEALRQELRQIEMESVKRHEGLK